MSFEPELGQAVFSNTPWRELPANSRLIAAIDDIARELYERGLTADDVSDNVGGEFINDVFTIRAYCWCDGERKGHEEGCPPNFEYGDLKVCWYKHSHRSASQNRPVTRAEVREIEQRCLNSLAGLPPKCHEFWGWSGVPCDGMVVQKVEKEDSVIYYCADHQIAVSPV